MHDAWSAAPDRAPGFSGSLIHGNRVFDGQRGHLSYCLVARRSRHDRSADLLCARVDAAGRRRCPFDDPIVTARRGPGPG